MSAVEDEQFWEAIKIFEEEKHIPYVTTGERIGIEKGLRQGLQQGLLEASRTMILEVLEEQFGQVPAALVAAIKQTEDRDLLHRLLRRAIRCTSVEEFQHTLDTLRQQT